MQDFINRPWLLMAAGVVLGASVVVAVWPLVALSIGQRLPEIIFGYSAGIAGGLIGGGMTLIAGWAAWSAAQDQIAEMRRPRIERETRATEFLKKYAIDWTEAINQASVVANKINPSELGHRRGFFVEHARQPLDQIREIFNKASLSVSSNLISNLTDCIDPFAYIAFVDCNGSITHAQHKERAAFNQMMSDERRYRTLSGEASGSKALEDELNLLKAAITDATIQIAKLNKILNRGR